MSVVCLAPLGAGRVLPFIDLPHHAALSALFWDTLFGRGDTSTFYQIDPAPMPYWTAYLLLAPAIRAFGVYTGTKIAVGISALSIPLGVMRLRIALGKDPRLGLLAFLLVWDFNLYFGWVNHVLGMGLALFALAALIEADSLRAALRVWPSATLLALTHVLPFGYFGLTSLFFTALRPGPRWRSLATLVSALALPSLTLVPWLWRSFQSPGARGNPGFHFDPSYLKVERIFTHTLGSGPPAPQSLGVGVFCFLVLLFGPFFFAFMKQAPSRSRPALAAAPFLAALILYFVLPLSVDRPVAHWGTYPRFATPMLLGLLLLPNPRLVGIRALALAPGLFVGALFSAHVAAQCRALDKALEGFYEIADLVPAGAKLLPLCYANRFGGVRAALGESLHGYITAMTGGYNPLLFGAPTNPVHYRAQQELPRPGAFGRNPKLFSMEQHGQYYDYILVLGAEEDPLPKDHEAGEKTATLVAERGRFRLYAVR